MQFDRYHVGWVPSRVYVIRRHLQYRFKHFCYIRGLHQNFNPNFIISIFTRRMRTYKKCITLFHRMKEYLKKKEKKENEL